jgi:hypothetical protein
MQISLFRPYVTMFVTTARARNTIYAPNTRNTLSLVFYELFHSNLLLLLLTANCLATIARSNLYFF